MFRNVHVGVDGGPTGRDAIWLARALAAPSGRLTLTHVRSGEMAPGGVLGRAFGAAGPEDAQRLLEAERGAAEVGAELIDVCARSVGRGLHALAEKHAADLLVVGSHTRGALGRVLMSDETRAALTGTPCAVAVAPRGYIGLDTGFATICVGYDYSGESRAALAAARGLANRFGSKISALHVVTLPKGAATRPDDWAEVLDEGSEYAQQKLESLEGVDATALYGIPSDELAALSDRVDLLVVGSRNHGPVRRLLLGSTSSSLACHAHCPLLVLPRGSTGEAQLAVERGGASPRS
jgi:nucleotide-binding universal stress UspA family protein